MPNAGSKRCAPAPQTYYRRELPNNLHAFDSLIGKSLFKKSLLAGHAENFFSLSGNYTTQSEPAYCGLSSLSIVLNAMAIDPGKKWKGVWRWYSDDMLECCSPLDVVKAQGTTFAEIVCIARCNGLKVTAKRADKTTYEQFLEDIRLVSSSADLQMIVSYSRKTLNQTGDGHFSPVGCFEPESSQVLILDTARFKYPSYFVDSKLLFDAMRPVDKTTNLPRGYMILSKGLTEKTLPLCRLSISLKQYQELKSTLKELVNHDDNYSERIRKILPFVKNQRYFTEFLGASEDLASNSEDATLYLQNSVIQAQIELKAEIYKNPIYSLLDSIIGPEGFEDEAVIASLFFLSLPEELGEEIRRMRIQIDELDTVEHKCGCKMNKTS